VAGVGGAAIGDAVAEASGRSRDEVWAAWSKYAVPVTPWRNAFPTIHRATSRSVRARRALRAHRAHAGRDGEEGRARSSCCRKVDAQGARYVVKILTRELRIGLVEDWSSRRSRRRSDASSRRCGSANMFTGDIGATALLAEATRSRTAKMSLFHPFAFMLAQPEEDPGGDRRGARRGCDRGRQVRRHPRADSHGRHDR
jgi:DNA ligase-1